MLESQEVSTQGLIKEAERAFESLWYSRSGQLAQKSFLGICPKTKIGRLLGASQRRKKVFFEYRLCILVSLEAGNSGKFRN